MRQNKRDISIHSLNEKKVRKSQKNKNADLESILKTHEKNIADIEFKTIKITCDMHNTQFIIPVNKNSQDVIDRYNLSRKHLV
jgi:hypothetical protein